MEYDQELVQSYIEESREHLASIEEDLVELERQGASRDDALINKIFRAAHSIKGGAGFFDFKVIKELAHKLENVLEHVRTGKMAPNPEVVTILLRGFDRLSGLIDAPEESEQADIADELVGLIGLAAAYAPGPSERPKVLKFAAPGSSRELEADEAEVDRLLGQDKSLFLLRFDLVHDVHRLGKSPLAVIHALLDSGEILDSALDYLSVGTLDSETFGDDVPYFVLYAAGLSLQEVSNRFELPLIGITMLRIPEVRPASAAALAPAPAPGAPAPASPAGAASKAGAASVEVAAPVPVARSATAQEAAASSAAASSAAAPTKVAGAPSGSESETVRVSVNVLDDLMNLSGELVLVRNELSDVMRRANPAATLAAAQRLNTVTANIQDAVMRSRMQPASNLFARFQRTVRDLARDLGKDIDLRITGKDTELDRSLIETLSDPLTHLVRNACDHGIEDPAVRAAAGKSRRGTISLSAAHVAGQILVLVEDDGKGINAEAIAAKAVAMGQVAADRVSMMSAKEKLFLITLPGLSTATKVSDLSGRGVGMDVVKANVDRLGGRIEIDSAPGSGTKVRITLPLTLSVIPALLAGVGDERFALPQAAAAELLHVRAGDVQRRIERVGDRAVLVLRGEVLPLVRLADAIGMERSFEDPTTGENLPDRRDRVEDRRSPSSEAMAAVLGKTSHAADRSQEERRFRVESDYRIIVVRSSGFRYGVIVDALFDTTEIVVKPLGRHLKSLKEYSGATILGDGAVALIIDPAGLALKAGLTGVGDEHAAEEEPEEIPDAAQGWLLFRNGPTEQCAMPLEAVERVVRVTKGDIDPIGKDLFLRVGGLSLPVFSVGSFTGLSTLDADSAQACVLCHTAGYHFGFLASPPVDSVSAEAVLDERSMRKVGVSGTAVIQGQTTVIIDPVGALSVLKPEWFAAQGILPATARPETARPRDAVPGQSKSSRHVDSQAGEAASALPEEDPTAPLLVLAEDSDFFRNMVLEILTEGGYRVRAGRDGLEALALVRELGQEVALVVTDVEMPRLDGRGLTSKLAEEFPGLPVIALTSLASDDDEKVLREAGAREYLVKLDRDALLASVASILDGRDPTIDTRSIS
ncbi:MAG: chemotaxis protein CheW [Rectinemataceae bacterium]